MSWESKLTEKGEALLASAINASFFLTKVTLGSETTDDLYNMVALTDEKATATSLKLYCDGNKSVVTFELKNTDIVTAFKVQQIGIWAKQTEADEDSLYMILQDDSDEPTTIKSAADSPGYTYAASVNIVVGSSSVQTVSADEAGNAKYDEVFDENGMFIGDKLKESVISFSEPTELSEISTADTVSTIFGKIKKAIKDFISHLANNENPHGVTYSQVGAAASSHNHSASQITSGTLAIARGGTGASTAAAALTKLGAQAALGFTPVRQGGGTDQLDNVIYIGWSGKVLKIQVDETDMGELITTGTANNAILPLSKGGTGATTAATAEAAIMPASTIAVSSFGAKRDAVESINSSYIKKIGKRINGSLILNNVTSSADCKAQIFTIASSYRPAGSHVGIVNVMTSNGNTYSRGCGFINVSEKDGIITLVLPSASATYPTVEVFFDYYIG